MSLGDPVEPYGIGGGLEEDAARIDELVGQLSDLLDDVSGRIDATEGTRRPIRDHDGEIPDIPDLDYPDLSEAQGMIGSIIQAFRKVSEDLSGLTDELQSAAGSLDANNEDARKSAEEKRDG